jgi:hypothetical protein
MYNPDHNFRTAGEKNRIHSNTLRNVESSVAKRLHQCTDVELKNQLAIELLKQKDLNQPILASRLDKTVAIHKSLMKTPNHRRNVKDFRAIEKKIDSHSNRLHIDDISDLLSKSDLLSLASKNCTRNVVKFGDKADNNNDDDSKSNNIDNVNNGKDNNSPPIVNSLISPSNIIIATIQEVDKDNDSNGNQLESVECKGAEEGNSELNALSSKEIEIQLKNEKNLKEIELENSIVEKEIAALFSGFGGGDSDDVNNYSNIVVDKPSIVTKQFIESDINMNSLDQPKSDFHLVKDIRLRRKEYSRITKW